MNRSNRVLIGITALNEATNLPPILEKINHKYDVAVIDDGSTDGTDRISRSYGAVVLRHICNLGQGCADITKYKYAINMDYDILVEMDGDGQHDPSEIDKLITRLKRGDVDIVQGSRIKGSNYDAAPFLRKTFLPLYTWIINKLTSYKMSDAMCGFRAFKVSALRKVFPLFDQMLEPQYLAAEMFIRFSRAGLSVGEIPINLQDRLTGTSYKGTIRYGVGVLRAMMRAFIDKRYYMEAPR